MPLSEHEQRVLEQMERALYEEDPRFAAAIRNTPVPSSRARRGAGVGVLVAAVGVVTIVVGLLQAQPIVGVFGFVAVLGGTYVAIRGVAAEGRRESAADRAKREGFLKNAEERFQNRRDGSTD
jgi:hypothetical protein